MTCQRRKNPKGRNKIIYTALLSITGAYSTTSTNALQVLAGQLPLDLEIKWQASLREIRSQPLMEEEIGEYRDTILGIWQSRWDRSDKGRWTYSISSDVKRRFSLPLSLYQFTTQFLTGHGDFNAKLKVFRLVEDAGCSCGLGQETVEHVLFECKSHEVERDLLRRVVSKTENCWPYRTSAFLDTRSSYEAFKRFSKNVLKSKKVLE